MAQETEALIFDRPGAPAEVLSLRSLPLPDPGPDGVRVRLRLSPINPADLNYIEGTYGIKPEPPAVGGLEGVGEVVAVGSGVTRLKRGALVSLPRLDGHWRGEWAGPAGDLHPFPPGLTPEQAALFRINPATAWCLLHEFVALKPGDWIVQNAATSAVGKAVIAIARHLALRTINLVRHEADIAKLKALGADLVVLTEGADAAAIKKEAGDPVKLALNAVGGESASFAAKLLTPGGIHVTYGAMARQPLKISNGALIFQDLEFRGFWVSRWRQQAPHARVAVMEQTLAAFFQSGLLQPEIAAEYPLSEFAAAVAHANQGGKPGKVVFRMR